MWIEGAGLENELRDRQDRANQRNLLLMSMKFAHHRGREPGFTRTARLLPCAGVLIFTSLEFRPLWSPVAGLPVATVAAVLFPPFHLFRDVVAELDFRRVNNVFVVVGNSAPDCGATSIDAVREWLDVVCYHVREPDGKGCSVNHFCPSDLEQYSCFCRAGGHQRLLIDVLHINEHLLMPSFPVRTPPRRAGSAYPSPVTRDRIRRHLDNDIVGFHAQSTGPFPQPYLTFERQLFNGLMR